MPTALIVEDEPEANRLLSMLLQLRGYTTESAYTGGEALQKVECRPPDLVFLDLMLPDINGYEVCRHLKSRRATSLIPVIMVTARVEAENCSKCYGMGADDYVAKPYTPDQIFQAMASASAWRHRASGQTIEGVIPLDPATGHDPHRLLARLRNALLGRTSLELEAITRILAALREIQQDATAWVRQTCQPTGAALGYLIQPDQLVITLSDSSEWLPSAGFDPQRRWPIAFAAARFDEVQIEQPGQLMTFSRSFPPCD